MRRLLKVAKVQYLLYVILIFQSAILSHALFIDTRKDKQSKMKGCSTQKEAQSMFVFYSVHYPQTGKEELWVQKMRDFDEVIKKQPGVLFVSDIFPDPAKGTLIGFTFWESEDAWKAAWPMSVQEAPAGEGEIKPADVFMFQSAV
jgi:heme-degrading monooxygenase HmoA